MDNNEYFIGIDIGGTKCAVIAGTNQMEILERIPFDTLPGKGPGYAILKLKATTAQLIKQFDDRKLAGIGISCGGPLNSKTGVVHSPPNLPGWDNIAIVDIIKDEFGVPVFIQNDANACALAEWKYGAGRGTENMVFLTFGTGLGAGLILDGKLFTGTNDNAGEVGHIRLADDGPTGYNKAGSFEGFCSGSGITKLAQGIAKEKLQKGESVSWCNTVDDIPNITTKDLARLANKGDKQALDIFRTSAAYLGTGLSILIDILNPERIVIGSVYARNAHLFDEVTKSVIKQEALEGAWNVCEIVKAELGDKVGDFASLSVSTDGYTRLNEKMI